MKFCPNYREVRKLVKRTVIRRILFVLLAILACEAANACLHAYSLYDRKILHNEALLTEKQVNARKIIQATGVNRLNKLNIWTEDDKRVISKAWRDAAYENEPNPFPEYEH